MRGVRGNRITGRVGDEMSRKPDYVVKALNKTTDAKGKVGVAWVNLDGTITVVLDEFVTLQGDKQLLITLFKE